jgi:hypothetical protein
MNKPYLIIFLFLYSFISTVVIFNFISSKESEPIAPIIIEKISSDTIYMELDSLKIKQDTIKLYYETKTNNYRTMPSPERVQLFTERINR